MTQELTIRSDTELTARDALAQAGMAANEAAARHTFADYRSRKAANTLRRQDADLSLFASFLAEAGVRIGDLVHDPAAWGGITWGLVKTFTIWQLDKGYSVGSVNVRLSTVKTYANLAKLAGMLDTETAALINSVRGYSRKEGKRLDETRDKVRNGAKKAEPVSISKQQAGLLKGDQPLTPQGRRDTVLMCLLLDHGLRASEVATLTVANFDLRAGTMTFYRAKVDKVQTHKLADDTWQALEAYFEAGDALAVGPLLRGSRKDGRLTGAGMNVRNISGRVKVLGERLDIEGLSAHDCRHHAATRLARTKSLKELMEVFGWASPAMAVRYIEDAQIIEVE